MAKFVDLKCPACGNTEEFIVEVSALVDVNKDGNFDIDTLRDPELNDVGWWECKKCGKGGIGTNYRTDSQELGVSGGVGSLAKGGA